MGSAPAGVAVEQPGEGDGETDELELADTPGGVGQDGVLVAVAEGTGVMDGTGGVDAEGDGDAAVPDAAGAGDEATEGLEAVACEGCGLDEAGTACGVGKTVTVCAGAGETTGTLTKLTG